MSRLSERLAWNPYKWTEPHVPPMVPREPPPLQPISTLDRRFTVHLPSMQCLPSSYSHPVKRPGHGSKYTPSYRSGIAAPVLVREPQNGFLLAVMVAGAAGRKGQ